MHPNLITLETCKSLRPRWRIHADRHRLLKIKGAPDVPICRCYTVIGDDGAVNELTIETRTVIKDITNVWSSQWKRVILLARKVLPAVVIVASPASNNFEQKLWSMRAVP